MIDFIAVETIHPPAEERISRQLAVIGAAILNALGEKTTADEMLCYPALEIDRRGPSGAELERRLIDYFTRLGAEVVQPNGSK